MKLQLSSLIAASALAVFSTGASALSSAPSATAESVVHPAANVCGYGYNVRPGSEITRYYGALQLSGTGSIMACALPVKYERYIERVVFDVYHHGVAPRSCRLSYVRAASGAIATNNSVVNMNYNASTGGKVWQYDDFGSVPADIGGNPQNILLLFCEHHNMTDNQFVRYGAIRIDYSKE